MRAAVLAQALAALRVVKDSPGTSVPTEIWRQCMYAHNVLAAEIELGTPAPQAREPAEPLACGHHHSLAVLSAEEPGKLLYCELCDIRSQRDDAVAVEQELRAAKKTAEHVPGDLILAVDAAMVEMKNIHPPLRRSDCKRLILAARDYIFRKYAAPSQAEPAQPQGAGDEH